MILIINGRVSIQFLECIFFEKNKEKIKTTYKYYEFQDEEIELNETDDLIIEVRIENESSLEIMNNYNKKHNITFFKKNNVLYSRVDGIIKQMERFRYIDEYPLQPIEEEGKKRKNEDDDEYIINIDIGFDF